VGLGVERNHLYIFRPPTSKENPMGSGRLFFRFLTPQGITVAKINGQYYEMRMPTTEEIETFDEVYFGGYEYEVTLEEKTDLESAGYEVIEI